MRDCGAHRVGGIVDLLELLVVLRLIVHLDLEREDLKELCSLLCDIFAICTFCSLVKISQNLLAALENSGVSTDT